MKDSNHTRSHYYDPYDIKDEDFRRRSVATAESIPRSGVTTHRLRLSTVSDLKEFNERDRDDDRARSCIGKIKSAFLRDQTEDPENCLILSDLLTGPARYWYGQLSRSTHREWKPLLECFMNNMEDFISRRINNTTMHENQWMRPHWSTCIV